MCSGCSWRGEDGWMDGASTLCPFAVQQPQMSLKISPLYKQHILRNLLCIRRWVSETNEDQSPSVPSCGADPGGVLVCFMQSCLSCGQLCDPMDCSPPGSSIHEIFQARILEWVAFSFSRGSIKVPGRFGFSWPPSLAFRWPPSCWVLTLPCPCVYTPGVCVSKFLLLIMIPYTSSDWMRARPIGLILT